MKRIERDHAKEKQKLVKDKDNGTSHMSPFHMWMSLMVSLLSLSSGFSEKPVDEGESDESKIGEPR